MGGSLHSFLGCSSTGGGEAHGLFDLKAATRLPPSFQQPEPRTSALDGNVAPPLPRRGGSLLNKKVAFRMLRQFGCEVKWTEPQGSGDVNAHAYVEVCLAEQPQLFQMLLDFGYLPSGSDSGPVVRVHAPKQRSQEEMVASLSAPRHASRGRPSVST